MKRSFSRFFGLLAGVALLAAPVQAMAQDTTPANGTITVTATGTASAPAESATIIITLGGDTSVMPYDAAATDDATIDPVPTTIDPTPVIDALVAAGVPADAIEIVSTPFSGDWGPTTFAQPVSLSFTMDSPDPAFLSTLLETTRTTASENGWLVNQFGVLYQVSNCSDLELQARTNAVANARTSATAQATAMETTLGAAIGSSDSSMYMMPATNTAACGADPATLGMSKVYMASSFDPSMPAEVTVTVSVNVTFAIP